LPDNHISGDIPFIGRPELNRADCEAACNSTPKC